MLVAINIVHATPFQESLDASLQDTPSLHKILISSVEFKEEEWKSVPSIQVDPIDLSKGYRTVWTFEARPKGEESAYPLNVSISTITIFYDDDGKPSIPQEGMQAKRFVEGITIVEKTK